MCCGFFSDIAGIGSQVCDVDELFKPEEPCDDAVEYFFEPESFCRITAGERGLPSGSWTWRSSLPEPTPWSDPTGLPVRGKSLFQRHALLGGHVCGGLQTAQPVGIERLNNTEFFKDEAPHVSHHQVAGKDVLQSIIADGFALLGA